MINKITLLLIFTVGLAHAQNTFYSNKLTDHNLKGQVKSYSEYSCDKDEVPSMANIIRTYYYNTKGFLIRMDSFEKGVLNEHEEYTYNTMDSVIVYTRYIKDNIIKESTLNEYGADKLLKKTTNYNRGKVADSYTYTYNNKRQLIEMKYFMKNNTFISKYHHTYNTKGLLEKTIWTDNKQKLQSENIYTYDTLNQLIEQRERDYKDIDTKYRKTYNTKRMCIRDEMIGKDKKVITESRYEYNDNNDLQKSQTMIPYMRMDMVDNYSYIYDENNNWTQMTCISKQKKRILKRVFEYYDN